MFRGEMNIRKIGPGLLKVLVLGSIVELDLFFTGRMHFTRRTIKRAQKLVPTSSLTKSKTF
jgi:hypothetical protein